MKLRRFLFLLGSVILVAVTFTACKISYSFTGASIAPNVKTFSVYYFPNRARLVNPNLSQQLTEGLQDKLIKQTSLNQISESGDLEFTGQITDYEVRPMNMDPATRCTATGPHMPPPPLRTRAQMQCR